MGESVSQKTALHLKVVENHWQPWVSMIDSKNEHPTIGADLPAKATPLAEAKLLVKWRQR